MLFRTKTKQTQEDEKTKPVFKDEKGNVYPTGFKLWLLMTSLFVSMFLVSLDRLIISTAIPRITDEFNSAGDIGWYGTAYLITNCAFQLVFGKLYKVFDVKFTFMTSLLLFEAGSALCGGAPNSIAFILGRALAGLGGGGILSGVVVVIVYSLPLHKRPQYQGWSGAVLGISSTFGPLVGGAFTTNVSWRWCFYINLPLGGAAAVLLFFTLQILNSPNTRSLKDKLQQLNVPGLLALFPGVICLCLALQWGGTTYAWSEGRIVALLVLAFVFFIAFALIQVWKPEQATMPPRIFVQRSVASGFWVSCCTGSHQTLLVYFLPIWFQVIRGDSAVKSGIDLLPMMGPVVVASILCGRLTSRIGYYMPFLIFGVCLTSIGAGLLTTLEVDTSVGKWVGYQILYGFGFGCLGQGPNMAAQTVLAREDVSIGASLMFFGQLLFGAVFVSVGQNVLANRLASRLVGIPGITPQRIQSTGATQLLKLIPAQYHAQALQAYNDSLRVCFQVALIMACLGILGALCMEWRSVRKNLPPKKPDAEQSSKEGVDQGDLSEKEASEAVAALVDGEKEHDRKAAEAVEKTEDQSTLQAEERTETGETVVKKMAA